MRRSKSWSQPLSHRAAGLGQHVTQGSRAGATVTQGQAPPSHRAAGLGQHVTQGSRAGGNVTQGSRAGATVTQGSWGWGHDHTGQQCCSHCHTGQQGWLSLGRCICNSDPFRLLWLADIRNCVNCLSTWQKAQSPTLCARGHLQSWQHPQENNSCVKLWPATSPFYGLQTGGISSLAVVSSCCSNAHHILMVADNSSSR